MKNLLFEKKIDGCFYQHYFEQKKLLNKRKIKKIRKSNST